MTNHRQSGVRSEELRHAGRNVLRIAVKDSLGLLRMFLIAVADSYIANERKGPQQPGQGVGSQGSARIEE